MTLARIARPEHPRPQFARRHCWLNLNGEWQFRGEPEPGGTHLPPLDQPLGGTIHVPFLAGTVHSGVPPEPFAACWYRRALTVPAHWRGQRILLHVGAAEHVTRVYLNETEVGLHVGGSTPFTIEATDCVANRGECTVTLYCEGPRETTTSHAREQPGMPSPRTDRTPGVWQTVWMEAVPPTFLAGAHLTPRLESAGLLVEAHVGGDTPRPGARLRLKAQIEGRTVGEADIPITSHRARGFLAIGEIRPWSPDDPFLYDLTLMLQDESGRTLDIVQSYFGLRSVKLRGRALEMNGRPLFQRLVVDPGAYPGGGPTAPSEDVLRNDVERARAMGFNGALLHRQVFDPRYLYWCDRLGFMVWGETPDWDLDVRDPEQMAAFIQSWVEQVERDHNHPSLVGWAPFNERSAGHDPAVRTRLEALTRALDGDRPIIDSTSGLELEESFLPGYKGATQRLLRRDLAPGFCYSQLYDTQESDNGLYTQDRKPKVDPGVLKSINEQPAAVEEHPGLALEEATGDLKVPLLTSAHVTR